MSIGDLSHGLAGGRVPLWSIAVAALLVTAGFGKRPYTVARSSGEASGAPAEDGRGRSAAKPSDIPIPGWRDIVLRVYEGISEDRILANAAAVTFYALLALFPGIAALVSIYGLFADPGAIVSQLDAMSGILPGGALDVIRDQLTHLTAQGSGKLGISLVIGLVISLWSANGGIKALFDALNVVYEEKEGRIYPVKCGQFVIHNRNDRLPAFVARLRCRDPGRPQLSAARHRAHF